MNPSVLSQPIASTRQTIPPEKWRRIDQLFDAALEREAADRSSYLAEACAGDDALLGEINSLLAACDEAGDFIEKPPEKAISEIAGKTAAVLTGKMIGHYRILREIGRGGMGSVYLAARTDDEFIKLAAIKLVWIAAYDDEIMRRFRQERQILAQLDHPNIARLLDDGTTDQGVPYVVMEYVEGVPITDYCNDRKLSINERLRLFQQVCAAVQYAHQNLVVHRDLKPGNIFVAPSGKTEAGGVKLLDFGIAKLLISDEASGEASNETCGDSITRTQAMTPEYASPEQFHGEPISTASDVYSLGVVLYEMLTGHSPYEFKERSLHEMARVVCFEEQPRPSARARQLNGHAANFPEGRRERLSARLRGDLDAIVLTALHKDPRRRYRSAEQLSEDIRRHLEDKAILARPATIRYRTSKFVTRHWLPLAAAMAVFLTLVAGIICTTWQMKVAARERTKAELRQSAYRRLAYASQMNLAAQAWETANISSMRRLLDLQSPGPGEEDLRGFEWRYLRRLLDRNGERLSLPHKDDVWTAAWSPDGKTLATGHSEVADSIKLWDVATGRLRASIKGHDRLVWSLAFSHDGKRLATASMDGKAKLFDLETGSELATFAGHTDRVNIVALAPDGKRAFTSSDDGTIRCWDTATVKEYFSLQIDKNFWVRAMALSPDGRAFAAQAPGGKIKLWDASDGREIASFNFPQSRLWSLAFSPNGSRLAAAGKERTVRVWDLVSGTEILSLEGHTGEIRSIAFSPDGKRLASASDDRTVRLWDAATGRELAALKGHTAEVWSVSFSPDGKSLATASTDFTAKLWDLNPFGSNSFGDRPVLIGDFAGAGNLAISPKGDKMAMTGRDNTVRLIDPASGNETSLFKGHTQSPTAVAFSRDGALLASGGQDKTAIVWDVSTSRRIASFEGHLRQITSLAFSPDGKRLLTGSYDKTARVFDIASGRELATLGAHTHVVVAVAYSPDGRMMATGSYDKTVKLWDASTDRELATYSGQVKPVLSLAFSPDGRTLAAGSADATVKLWDIAAGRELFTLKGAAGHLKSLVFSPDGRRLATGSGDGLVRLWDTRTGQEVLALKGHSDAVVSVAFCPKGATLVSGSQDRTVRVWRAGFTP